MKKLNTKRAIYGGSRVCGKTSFLIEESSKTRVPILCTNRIQKKLIKKQALENGISIPNPLSLDEITELQSVQRGQFNIDNEILVDNVEQILYHLLRMNVRTATTSLEIINPPKLKKKKKRFTFFKN